MLSLHFNRAIKNRISRVTFLLVLLFHVGLAIYDICNSLGEPLNFLYDFPAYILGTGVEMKYRRFFEFNEFYMHLFVLFVAVLPYASSFYDDREQGILNSLLTRAERWKYIASGLLVNFIVSFMTYFLPKLVLVSMYAIAFPTTHIKIGYSNLNSLGSEIASVAGFRDLFMYQPYLYFLVITTLGGLYVALFSSCVYALAMSVKKHKYIIIILPVLLVFIVDMVCELSLGPAFSSANIIFSSDMIYTPRVNYNLSLVVVFIILLLAFSVTFTVGVRRNKDIL